MPSFLVPRRVSAHRIAIKALYRALLSQCRASPFPPAQQEELQNIARNRFKQAQHDHSHNRLRFSLQGAYEAIDLLDASVAGDDKSTRHIAQLLEGAPDRVKQPPPRKELRRAGRIRSGSPGDIDALSGKPTRPILKRPRSFEELSGRRHIPRLVSASGVPMLRIKKPQPAALSGFIRHRVQQRERRHDLRHSLTDQIALARTEDNWDHIIEEEIDGLKPGGRTGKVPEPQWVGAPYQARKEVQNLIDLELEKNTAMAKKMQEIVDREEELYAAEKVARKSRQRMERKEKRRSAKEALKPDLTTSNGDAKDLRVD